MKLYIDVFIIGVATSWGMCFCFCTPAILTYIAATEHNWLAGLKISLAFSLARIVPYIILSLISAAAGRYLIGLFYEGPGGHIAYIVSGVLITLLGILILIGKMGCLHCCPPFAKQHTPEAVKGLRQALLLGALTYIAFNARNLLHGACLGLSFGLGTLISPLIIFGPLSAEISSFLFKKSLLYKIFIRICGLLLLYFGIGMISEAISYGTFGLR